ncbi:MAG TPA: hypothetical protein VIM96_08890 [Pseudomonadales bacterium]|jgi:hypothetical protein
MADILEFKKPRAKPKGLCQHGHHRWVVCKDRQFDVKQGKLITVYRCERCGEKKVTAQ